MKRERRDQGRNIEGIRGPRPQFRLTCQSHASRGQRGRQVVGHHYQRGSETVDLFLSIFIKKHYFFKKNQSK